MMTTTNTGSKVSLLNGAAFACVTAQTNRVGGIMILDVAIGRGDAILATYEVTLFRGRIAPKQTSGGRVPPTVEAAMVAALEAMPEVTAWR